MRLALARTGQKLGPAAARHASWEQFVYGESLEDGAVGWYDIESDRDCLRGVTMVDVGDVLIQGADDHGNFARMREAANRIVGQGCVLVAVGGDHSISFPLVRGVAAHRRVEMVHESRSSAVGRSSRATMIWCSRARLAVISTAQL